MAFKNNELIELKVEGMTCTNCAASINKYLERKGLENVYVNFQTHEVRFKSGRTALTLQEVKAGIEKLGFQIVEPNQKAAWWSLERKLIVSAFFTTPLLLHHLLDMLGSSPLGWLHNFWVQLLICLPVFVLGFLHFGKSAWNSLRMGIPNMDVLIWLGSTAAFAYSLVGTLLHDSQYIFYETAATIITLVFVGNWLERRAVAQTTSAIDELSKLQTERANRVMPSGAIVVLPLQDVKVGDFLQVNEGEAVPADGIILEGAAFMNESMLTGESEMIEKQQGENVVGASIVKKGNFVMKVTAIGQQTVLQQIIELVKNAQQEKPAIQRLADKISTIFVPIVVTISILTFLIAYFVFDVSLQQALMNSIAVLVISCPCAMGLATPTAVMVGVARMARNGILVKGGQTMETFANIQNFIFDKTGTLTTGKFQIQDIQYFTEETAEALAVIYALEKKSSHPIAQSIVQLLENQVSQTMQPTFTKVEEIKGQGLYAEDNLGNSYRLGAHRFVQDYTDDEKHQLYLVRNTQLLATMNLADEMRQDAQKTIQFFLNHNKNVVLMSGDRLEKVEAMASTLGINTYYASQLPEEKLKHLESFTQQQPTAMVGDGINDAPALAKATIGISLSQASKVAIQAAQIVLLNGKLSSLITAYQISQLTLKTIRQNLFWAFAYNIVAIPIAAVGMLNPMWGALFMAFSDVVVIGNSIRLNWKKVKYSPLSKN